MSRMDDYDQLANDLVNDPDTDVDARNDGLYTHGHRFAYLDGAALAVRLPAARARDLATRGIGEALPDASDPAVGWVRVTESDDWVELAGEAHTAAHGPLPGRDS
jgi:hypothetical protein